MTETQTPADATTPPASDAAHPWAELAAEQFELLRLAALPADRRTGARPLRFARLGRVVRHSKRESLLRLSVQLPGQRLRAGENLVEVWVDHNRREVRFGPTQGLQISPENRGLGRFLLAQAIAWSKQHFAHYQVEGGTLPGRDAVKEGARAARDRCLQAQGFTLDYLDALQLQGWYWAPRVADLSEQWQTDKVQPIETLEAAALLQQAEQSLQGQAATIRQLQERIERLQRDDGGLRFTISCLVAFCLFQAGLLIWMASR